MEKNGLIAYRAGQEDESEGSYPKSIKQRRSSLFSTQTRHTHKHTPHRRTTTPSHLLQSTHIIIKCTLVTKNIVCCFASAVHVYMEGIWRFSDRKNERERERCLLFLVLGWIGGVFFFHWWLLLISVWSRAHGELGNADVPLTQIVVVLS